MLSINNNRLSNQNLNVYIQIIDIALAESIVIIFEKGLKIDKRDQNESRHAKNCVEIFVVGYQALVGVQFWIIVLTFVGEIIYWAERGRFERCPVCNGKQYETSFKKIDVSSQSVNGIIL